MKDKPHQLRRLSIRWSSSSHDMPRDGFASNSASRRRASAIPSFSSWRPDGSDPSRCAARTAFSVSGKSSASFSTPRARSQSSKENACATPCASSSLASSPGLSESHLQFESSFPQIVENVLTGRFLYCPDFLRYYKSRETG
jgi:hypothetical protein